MAKTIKKAQKGTSLKDYVNKSFKTVDSLRNANPKYGSKGLRGMVEERSSNRAKADSIEKAVEKRVGVPRKMNLYEQKNGGITKKAKKGGSFPDLNKDGKITKADILKGRGVIAKGGSKVKKAMIGTTTPEMRASRARMAGERAGAPMRRKARAAAAMASAPMMKKGGKAPKKMMGGGKCRGGCY